MAVKSSIPKIPNAGSVKRVERTVAKEEFTMSKISLNDITSWDLGDVVLEPFFTYTINDQQAQALVYSLNKLSY